MDSKVTFKEIIVMCLVITSFTVTGVMIMNENYRIALISLCSTSLCVLIMFFTVMSAQEAEEDRLPDMSKRNEQHGITEYTVRKKSGRKKKLNNVTDYSHYNDDNDYMFRDTSGDFYESVGNMRVYKRGEKIELHNDEEDENLE